MVSIEDARLEASAADKNVDWTPGESLWLDGDHEAEHGYFYMDPCNLHPGEEKIVATRLHEELGKATASNEIISTPFEERYARRIAGLMRWPD